jgi:hypothetical protein
MRTRGAVVLLMIVLTGVTGCAFGSGNGLTASVTFGMITFAIDSDGKVSVSVGAKFATPFGTIAVGAKHTEPFANADGIDPAEAAKGILVVIRLPDGGGGRKDVIYRVDSPDAKVIVELDGHVVEQIEHDRIFIETSPGTTVTIRQAPAGTSAGVPVDPVTPQVPEGFLGTWSGTIAEDGDEYGMDLVVRSPDASRPIGTVGYPRLGCFGSLELAQVDGSDLIHVTETMTRNPSNDSGGPACVSPHTFTLTANPDGTVLAKWDGGAGVLSKTV